MNKHDKHNKHNKHNKNIEEQILNLLNNNKYKDIIEIKNFDDITIEENYIFHLLIIRGNEDGINFFIKAGYDPYTTNLNAQNIIHLLFKNGFDELAEKYYKIYPDMLSKYNNELAIPLFYCVDRINVFKKCFEFMIKHECNIKELINTVTFFNDNIITRLIDFSYLSAPVPEYLEFIEENIDMIDFSLPNKYPPLIYSIETNKINLAKIFIKHKKGLQNKNYIFLSPLNIACTKNNIEITKLLLKHNDINYGGPENEYLPINIAINNNLFDLLDLLIDYINEYKGDFMIIDKYRNTYIHYIADRLIYLYNNNESEHERRLRKILLKIIKKSDIDFKNNDKLSARELLLQYIKIKQTHDKKDDISNIKNILENKNEKDSISEEEFKLVKSNKHYNTGLFGADIFYKTFYLIYLLEKYKDISIPTLKYSENEHKKLLYLMNLQTINYNPYYYVIASIYYSTLKYLYPIIPSNILWKNKDLHYIHPDMFENIKNIKTRFVLLTISLIVAKDYTHANCIIIDKKNKNIRRFEPYGITNLLNENDLNDFIHKNIEKTLKTKFKYIKPSDYLEKVKFQVISNDNNDDFRKMGDPMGYCLAWCLWYVELKLNNPDLEETDMIREATDKIMIHYKKFDNPYLSFIRDYARKLNTEKDKILKKIKINKNESYDINYKQKNLKKISEYIINYKFT